MSLSERKDKTAGGIFLEDKHRFRMVSGVTVQ